MRKLIEQDDAGLVALIGETVTCLCVNYFYTGKLTAINDTCIELTDPSIVYETGEWSSKAYTDVQKLPCKSILIMLAAVESVGVLK